MKQVWKYLDELEVWALGRLGALWVWGKRHPLWSLFLLVGIVAAFFLTTHLFGWTQWADWTGFGNTTKTLIAASGETTQEISPGKTLWDFLGIILGAIVALFIAILNENNQAKRKKTEIEIATDRQRENVLQTYLDDMGKLLMKNGLKSEKEKPDSPIVDVAQVKTVSALRMLDKERRDHIFQFLRDAGLTDFILQGVSMPRIDLSQNNLSEFVLNKADLSDVDFSGADLSDVNLNEAELFDANLTVAWLLNAELKGAYLTGAIVTQEQLSQAASLQGTTMPDGTIHE